MCVYIHTYIYTNIWDYVASTDGQCSAPKHPQQYPQQQPSPLLDDSQVIHNQTIPSHPKRPQANTKTTPSQPKPIPPKQCHRYPTRIPALPKASRTTKTDHKS